MHRIQVSTMAMILALKSSYGQKQISKQPAILFYTKAPLQLLNSNGDGEIKNINYKYALT